MKKLPQFFLIVSVIVLLSQSSCDMFSEREKTPGTNNPAPKVAIYSSPVMMNLPDSVRIFWNGAKYPFHLHAIFLPYNCPFHLLFAMKARLVQF